MQSIIKWIPLDAVILALTPQQKWKAARDFNTNIFTQRMFIMIGVISLIILTMLFIIVSIRQKKHERKFNKEMFSENAKKRGLSDRERQILLLIVAKAGLKRSEAIFTMSSAFDTGAARIIEESFTLQGAEQSRQLQAELSSLREKLGFRKQSPPSVGSPIRPKKLTSRQIPIGKKLHITRRKARDSDDIESTVIKNNNMELTVQLAVPLESTPGDLWCARYYFGASVWEFDTSVVSCNGNILVLNHNDDVRFINRRRFLRVPVKRPAFITRFPFAKTLVDNSDNEQDDRESGDYKAEQDSTSDSEGIWKPLEFVPAIVTELAGPGLRMEAPLEVKVGDRVLVMFRLDEEIQQDSDTQHQNNKTLTAKIIEDIGEVRHIKAIQNGFSIAVELIGLSDSDVSKLIQVTNTASLRANAERQNTSSSVETKAHLAESVAVQTVTQGA